MVFSVKRSENKKKRAPWYIGKFGQGRIIYKNNDKTTKTKIKKGDELSALLADLLVIDPSDGALVGVVGIMVVGVIVVGADVVGTIVVGVIVVGDIVVGVIVVGSEVINSSKQWTESRDIGSSGSHQ